MPKPSQLLGKRFGRLLVTEQASSNHRGTRWACICDCGVAKTVVAQRLLSGHTNSCGCLSREVHANRCRNVLPEVNQKGKGEALRGVVLSGYRHNAHRKGYDWLLTDEQAFIIFQTDCWYCGSPPRRMKDRNGKQHYNGSYRYNGIDRVNNAKGYTADNVVPCCTSCNMAKRSMTSDEFIAWALRLAAHQRLKQSND